MLVSLKRMVPSPEARSTSITSERMLLIESPPLPPLLVNGPWMTAPAEFKIVSVHGFVKPAHATATFVVPCGNECSIAAARGEWYHCSTSRRSPRAPSAICAPPKFPIVV